MGRVPVGGAKRAFIRLKTLGQRGRPDFRALNEEYKKARAERRHDFKTAVAMAKAGRRSKRASAEASQGGVFGANSRAMRRTKACGDRIAFWRRTQGMEPEQRSLSLSEHIVQQGLTLTESLSLARSCTRIDGEQALAASTKAMESLVAYREGIGAADIQAAVQAMPSLSAFRLRAEPAGPCTLVEVLPPALSSVIDTAAWAYSASGSNLSGMLEKDWNQRHQVAYSSDCPPELSAQANMESDDVLCLSAGVCLCSDTGKITKQIGDRLLAHMRKYFPRGSETRQKLLEGFVVLSVVGEPASDDYEDIVGSDNLFGEVLFHCGLHYLSPFRPTFMKVEEVAAGGEAPAVEGRRYVKVRGWKLIENHHMCLRLSKVGATRESQHIFVDGSCRFLPSSEGDERDLDLLGGDVATDLL